jgi:hypothetical protein
MNPELAAAAVALESQWGPVLWSFVQLLEQNPEARRVWNVFWHNDKANPKERREFEKVGGVVVAALALIRSSVFCTSESSSTQEMPTQVLPKTEVPPTSAPTASRVVEDTVTPPLPTATEIINNPDPSPTAPAVETWESFYVELAATSNQPEQYFMNGDQNRVPNREAFFNNLRTMFPDVGGQESREVKGARAEIKGCEDAGYQVAGAVYGWGMSFRCVNNDGKTVWGVDASGKPLPEPSGNGVAKDYREVAPAPQGSGPIVMQLATRTPEGNMGHKTYLVTLGKTASGDVTIAAVYDPVTDQWRTNPEVGPATATPPPTETPVPEKTVEQIASDWQLTKGNLKFNSEGNYQEGETFCGGSWVFVNKDGVEVQNSSQAEYLARKQVITSPDGTEFVFWGERAGGKDEQGKWEKYGDDQMGLENRFGYMRSDDQRFTFKQSYTKESLFTADDQGLSKVKMGVFLGWKTGLVRIGIDNQLKQVKVYNEIVFRNPINNKVYLDWFLADESDEKYVGYFGKPAIKIIHSRQVADEFSGSDNLSVPDQLQTAVTLHAIPGEARVMMVRQKNVLGVPKLKTNYRIYEANERASSEKDAFWIWLTEGGEDKSPQRTGEYAVYNVVTGEDFEKEVTDPIGLKNFCELNPTSSYCGSPSK